MNISQQKFLMKLFEILLIFILKIKLKIYAFSGRVYALLLLTTYSSNIFTSEAAFLCDFLIPGYVHTCLVSNL
jgi:hypothetical protein